MSLVEVANWGREWRWEAVRGDLDSPSFPILNSKTLPYAAWQDQLSALLKKGLVSRGLRVYMHSFSSGLEEKLSQSITSSHIKKVNYFPNPQKRRPRERGEGLKWFFSLCSLARTLSGMTPGIEVCGWPHVFFSKPGELLPVFQRLAWVSASLPLGLRWSVVAHEGSGGCLSLPPPLLATLSIHQDVWTTRNLLIFLHTEDKAWIVICSFFNREKTCSWFYVFVCIMEIIHQSRYLGSVEGLQGTVGPESISSRDVALLLCLGMRDIAPQYRLSFDNRLCAVALWSTAALFMIFWLWVKPGRAGLLPLQFSGSVHFVQRKVW